MRPRPKVVQLPAAVAGLAPAQRTRGEASSSPSPRSAGSMASHGLVVRQVVGLVYPAYKSLQAAMTEEDREDDMAWLRLGRDSIYP